METIKGKVACKAGNGISFKIGNDWYNVKEDDKANIDLLKTVAKGNEVEVGYEMEGKYKRIVKKLTITSATTPPPAEEKKADPKAEGTQQKSAQSNAGSSWTKLTPEQEAEKQRHIIRGNALNASCALFSGRTEDPDTLKEMVLKVANQFVDWLSI
jgi:hypothetical protein